MAESSGEIEISVGGRVCLFGEHTDWAGEFRSVNADIPAGRVIVAGTEETIDARVRQQHGLISVCAVTDDGSQMGPWECKMDSTLLLAAASQGGFWSYVAGVAYVVKTYHNVEGVSIDNHATSLPIGKGLSSSAAVCVLVARAFNLLYNLKLTVRGEMEYAYRGELLTPSKCGRMDQCCAFGRPPTVMTFDGGHLECTALPSPPSPIFLVIVDLCASKDTSIILADLQKAYPRTEGMLYEGVRKLFGEVNEEVTTEAIDALKDGDARRLGQLMTSAQQQFDRYAAPACPAQLQAPILHSTLAHASVAPLVWGGKGVGSQGDGTAQFVARSQEDRERLCAIFEEELGMRPLRLTLGEAQ